MQAMPVKWKVKEILEAHHITPYRFMKESGLSQGTAYRVANNRFITVNAQILDATMRALRSLTGEPVRIEDVLEYQEKGE